MKNYHITHRPGDQWAAKQENTERAAAVFQNQQQAFEYARAVAQKHGGEVFIHGRDGLIRERNTYNKNDPASIKG
jgi:hypothetical protein